MAPAELARRVKPYVAAAGLPELPDAELETVCRLQQERAKTLVELVELSRYFFVRVPPEEKAAAKHLSGPSLEYLRELRDALAAAPDAAPATVEPLFQALVAKHGIGLGKVAQPVRVALTGGTASPGIYDVIAALGKDESVARIDEVLKARS